MKNSSEIQIQEKDKETTQRSDNFDDFRFIISFDNLVLLGGQGFSGDQNNLQNVKGKCHL